MSADEPAGHRSAGDDDNVILMFDTTHLAMEAEQQIIDGGFWCEVVPRPPATMSSLCGLAIAVLPADAEEVKALLRSSGIAFEVYRPEVEAH